MIPTKELKSGVRVSMAGTYNGIPSVTVSKYTPTGKRTRYESITIEGEELADFLSFVKENMDNWEEIRRKSGREVS